MTGANFWLPSTSILLQHLKESATDEGGAENKYWLLTTSKGNLKEKLLSGSVVSGEKNRKVKVKLIYIATLYLHCFVAGPMSTQSVIHLYTMQFVGSCGDDMSISTTGVF